MLRRILRSMIVLGVLVAAYQAYARFAVPLMEPPLALQPGGKIPFDPDLGGNSVSKYQLLLSNYFPKGHWSQTRPPKVIANGTEKAMLVLDDYKRHDNGQVDIDRFALLVFPTPPREGITPPRDAIVLEAPQGAKLMFDNFRPERGQIGQITRGSFPGKITIRSDMHEPGPEDDLLVETSDLEMNTKLMFSNSPVRFRMGDNIGGGRELEIRFLSDEHVQPQDAGLKIAGIDSLEIRREVRLLLQLESDSLLPGDKKLKSMKETAAPYTGKSGSHAEPATADLGRGNEKKDPRPPVEVTCSGPFMFDFVRYVASVDRDVELRQLNPNGPSDQVSCNQLDIHFAPRLKEDHAAESMIADPGKRQRRDLGRLEPAAIVAQGHPVVVISPSKNAEARGDRIQIGLREQRVRIDGGRDAVLIFGDNVLRAPVIDYQHPAPESGSTIGRFGATGPGTLHYVPDPNKPQQVFRAAWQKSVLLNREKGQPVLALDGRPQFGFADTGSLAADQIRIYLRELEGKGGVGLAISGSGKTKKHLSVSPDRLLAVGNVEIMSARLTGRTGRLMATFNIKSDVAPQADSNAGSVNLPAAGTGEQRFHIETDQMRIDVSLFGQSAVPSSLQCDGNVCLREVPTVATDQQPLEIRGAQLTADQLEQKTPHMTLRGARATGVGSGAGEASGTQLAQLIGRGMNLQVDTVEVDGNGNRLWSDGPGKATLQVARNLAGQAAAQPFPLEVTWQGGLRFDGQTVSFNDDVLVDGMDSTLRCKRLTARLTAPIKFGEPINQANIDLSEIECQGQVLIDHLSRDAVGITSHERGALAQLTINQQTGAISGAGPGVIRSTRFGAGLATIARGQSPLAPQLTSPPPGTAGSKLHFLRVDFNAGLTGNLYTRELTFSDRVRTIYGPVDSWEQELDPTQPQNLPPDTITLTCDQLRLNEDPIAARMTPPPVDGTDRPIGKVQMQAQGNVEIAGQMPRQGEFTVQAERASYEEAKDAFILEGSVRNPAKLWRRPKPGVDLPPTVARRIRYARATNDVRVDELQYLEITPQDVENARRPSVPTR
jgi:hypothetical protein